MNKENELNHRLSMISDDLRIIRSFINDNGLIEKFSQPTDMADQCMTHFNNIEIACDITDQESISWSQFTI